MKNVTWCFSSEYVAAEGGGMESRMTRRKMSYGILACLLAAGILSGCKSDTSKKEQLSFREKGITCIEKGDYKGAVKAFQKALDCSNGKITDTEIDICYYKAQAQLDMGDRKGAEESYSALIRYDKTQTDAYYLRGSLELADQKKEEALSDFDESLSNGSFELYYGVCRQLVDAGEDEKAEKYCKKAIQLEPETPEDHTWAGRMYLLLKDYDNAQEQFDIASEQGDAEAYLFLAEVSFAEDVPQEAESYYQEYAEKHAKDGEALNRLGELLMEKHFYSEAVIYFQEGIEVADGKEKQKLRKNEIIALEKSGDFAAAKEKIVSYTEDYPQDQEAQKEAVFLETRN